jgi:hypothetical protein
MNNQWRDPTIKFRDTPIKGMAKRRRKMSDKIAVVLALVAKALMIAEVVL